MSEFLGIGLLVHSCGMGEKWCSLKKAFPDLFSSLLCYWPTTYLHQQKPLAKQPTILEKESAAERVIELLETENRRRTYTTGTVNQFKHGVHFEQISFTYEDQPLFSQFDLTIKKGETVALVGDREVEKPLWLSCSTAFMMYRKGP